MRRVYAISSVVGLVTDYLGKISVSTVLATKTIATTIVVTNKTFSNPRRVVWIELASPPPKALPALAPVCWRRIESIRIQEVVIWIHGKRDCIIPIRSIVAYGANMCKLTIKRVLYGMLWITFKIRLIYKV